MSGLSPGGGLSNRSGLTGAGGVSIAALGLGRGSGLSPGFGPPAARLFGVNLSGAEYPPVAGQTFPSAADWAYLGGFGIKQVRLPLAWESLQTTLGGTLNATYLASIKTAIASAAANGIGVIIDIHNFGGYIAQATWTSTGGSFQYAGNAGQAGTGVSFLGNGVTSANLADLWTKLSTALLGLPGLVGYAVMNEFSPNIGATNLLQGPNYLLPNAFVASGFTNPATGSSTKQANGSNPLGAAYGPAWSITDTAVGGGGLVISANVAAVSSTLSVYAKVATGTATGFTFFDGTATGISVTTSWQRFTKTATPTAGAKFFGFGTTVANTPIQFANAQLETGGSATAYVPNPASIFVQAAINAVRAVDTVTPIYISGYNAFGGASWPIFNWELGQLTGTHLIFDCHQYFDGPQGIGGGGQYSGTWTSYGIDNNSGVQSMAGFTNWLSLYSLSGFVGEFGIPNSNADANSNWFILQQNFLNYLRTQNLLGVGWSYGSNGGQSGNILNMAPVGGVEDPRFAQLVTS